MKPFPIVLVVLLYLGGLGAADEERPSLAEHARLLGTAPETGWLSEAVPVALEAKELGGIKEDKLRLAVRFRPDKEGAKGAFVFGLAQPSAMNAKVIHRPLSGKYELTEKEGKRVLTLSIEMGAKVQSVAIPFTLEGKKLTFPKGVTVKGWESQGVNVYLSIDKEIGFAAK